MAAYPYSNADENRFWLQIMGDNALMIYNRLTPDISKVSDSNTYCDRFNSLLARARQTLEAGQLEQLNRKAMIATQDFRAFILEVLRDNVTKNFSIFLKPVYLNNMVSLSDEYLYILDAYLQNRQPAFDPIVQDIFWIPIFYSDARLISDNVGDFQEEMRQKAIGFAHTFYNIFGYAVSLNGIYRIGVTDFPIANWYRKTVREKLELFAEFIVDMIELALQNMIPGTLTLLNLDHIYRKLCYYTTQLAIMAGAAKPACDPTSPRRISFVE